MMRRICLSAACAAVAAARLTAVGETAVYVAENGDDSAAGTFEAPLGTIKTALGKSTSVVYVMPGTYSEHDITLNRAVRVVGLGGCRDDVIVDAKEAGRCFSLTHSGAVVSSLTMKNGKGNGGGNLSLQGGIVTNCVLSGGVSTHSSGFAGNAYATGGTIVDSVLDGGTVTGTYGSGFALRAEGENTRVMRCVIRNASSTKSITYGVYMQKSATIENCLLTGLSCGGTGRVIILDGSTAINCTVVGNTCSHSGIYLFGESARVINCVSIGNGGSSELEIGTGAQWSGFTACASPQTVDGCVTVASVDAARFRDPAGGDYSIEEESPLADRGDLGAYNSLSASNLDLGLRMRPNVRGKVSIGAYEPIADAHKIVARLAGSYSTYDGRPHQCALTVLEPAIGWTAKWRDVEDDGEDFSRDETPTYVDVGCYTNVVRISAPDYEDVYLTNTVRIATENVCFVSPSGDDLALGTEADPFRTIARALEFAQSVDLPGRVLIKDGVYRDDYDLQVTGPVEVRGLSGDRTKVIVDARGYGRCFHLQNDKAVVSSLTMTNGAITAKGAGAAFRGGNFLLDGGTVTNCVVANGVVNDANGGGGNAYIISGRVNLVVDCVFEGGSPGSYSNYGAGISIRAGGANTRVMRCVFRNASCSKSFTYGVYMESGAIIENCLLTGFSCGGTGRAIILDGATAVNCTVVGNTCSNSGIYLFGDSARAINSVSLGNGGSSELEIGTGAQWSGFTACASPMTVDGCVTVASVDAARFNNPANGDFMLRGSSPLIGKGSVSGYGDLAVSATDLAGEKRFSGNGKKICIGAYESALKGLAIILATSF